MNIYFEWNEFGDILIETMVKNVSLNYDQEYILLEYLKYEYSTYETILQENTHKKT